MNSFGDEFNIFESRINITVRWLESKPIIGHCAQ